MNLSSDILVPKFAFITFNLCRYSEGQSQKEQKAVLDAFRHGSLNTIVATSIGEEGLDIPAVDLIVFFDVVVGGLYTSNSTDPL